jgi:hypothetical protein
MRQNAQLLDLFAKDSWRRVYAGELEVRPPGAPTPGANFGVTLTVGKPLATTQQ